MIMNEKYQRREVVKKELDSIVKRINGYLKGQQLPSIKPILTRLGRNQQLPHWFPRLETENVLPNLDGKTVGSVIEMLFAADIEANVLKGNLKTAIRINPASGVDLPDLDLGIKSPSENWCTSEPFSNAYERLLGLEFDVIALITNYQTAKENPPLKLQLIHHNYFQGYEIADKGLCEKAAKIRDQISDLGETSAKKIIRFLAYANQSDWFCKNILKVLDKIDNDKTLAAVLQLAILDYEKAVKKSKKEIPLDYCEKIKQILEQKPIKNALINTADDWVVENWRDTASYPSHGDWNRFQTSPLKGALGVSFALQWRYNFGIYFRGADEAPVEPPAKGLAK